jgi:hypothetical protein
MRREAIKKEKIFAEDTFDKGSYAKHSKNS